MIQITSSECIESNFKQMWLVDDTAGGGRNVPLQGKALCHKYVDRKDLAGLFCIRESSNESEKKKEDSTPE